MDFICNIFLLIFFSFNLFSEQQFLSSKSLISNKIFVDEGLLLTLEKNIVDQLSLFSLEDYKGKKYVYESSSLQPNIWGIPPLNGVEENAFRTLFVRVGNLFIIDAAYKMILSNELKNYKDNVIFIKNLRDSELGIDIIRDSTLSAIIALLNVNLNNKIWVDLGAGSGILSVIAQKRGAKLSILIEKNNKSLAEENLRINGLKMGEFLFFGDDLKSYQSIMPKIQDIIDGENVIIGMNLGYWIDYNITNITGIALLDSLIKTIKNVNIERVILGGHNPKITNYFSSRWMKNYEEHDFLRSIGFNPATPCLNIDYMGRNDDEKFILFTGNINDKYLVAIDSNPMKREVLLMSSLGYDKIKIITLTKTASEAVTLIYEKVKPYHELIIQNEILLLSA